MQKITRLAALAVVSLATAVSGATRTCVTSTSEGFAISPNFACDTVHSNPLYQGSGTSGENPLYGRSADGSTRITLCGNTDHFRCVGAPAAAGDGTVFIQAADLDTDNVVRMYVIAPGKAPAAIDSTAACTGDVSGSPACDSTGRVVFKSLSNGAPVLTSAAPGSRIGGTFPQPWSSLDRVACDSQGGIAAVASPAGSNSPALYVGSATGGLKYAVTINGNNFQGACAISPGAIAGIAIGTATSAQFVVSPRDHASGLPTGKRMHKPITVTSEMSVACDQNSSAVALCDGSNIQLIDSSNDTSGDPVSLTSSDLTSIAAAPATNFAVLLSAGSPLGGSTIQSLALSPQSFTSTGELMFWASLTDGTTGIYAISVPEPTTLAAIGGALVLAARRRNR